MKKQTFKELIDLARQESCPQVDMTDRIMYRIASFSATSVDPYRAYAWIGSISGAVAACILIAVTLTWQANNDSVSQMMTMVSWVAQ